MFKRTAVDLGLDLVLKTVACHALSPEGAKAVENAQPVFHTDAYLKRQSQVSAVMFAISEAAKEDGTRVEVFHDLSSVFESISRNPTLSLVLMLLSVLLLGQSPPPTWPHLQLCYLQPPPV